MQHTKEEIYQIVDTGKPYWFVELKDGPKRNDETDAEAAALQISHLDHLFTLKKQGKLLLAGPTPKATELRGICIFDGNLSQEDVLEIIEADPMVKAGRLSASIHDFFGIPGDQLR